MTTYPFNLKKIDPSWEEGLQSALLQLDPHYLSQLAHSQSWLPGAENIFNAFTLPINRINYVLLGESPYPRHESANGYAFWDAAVHEIWSPTGLSKKVNRATSLRNIVKMLLIAEGLLSSRHLGQESIARINKHHLIQTNTELFSHFLDHGFLLLNATLVLQPRSSKLDAHAWYPFIYAMLDYLIKKRPNIILLLLGRIAQHIQQFLKHHAEIKALSAEHPYNLSFITNEHIINFFKPLHLLRKN